MSKSEGSDSGSTKPYLVRAIYDWSLDEGLTPQIMVDADSPGVTVPLSYAKDGKIVLNLHPSSVRGLEIGNEHLLFSARFSGRAENITVPIDAVLAVYARENGQGIVFQPDGSGVTPPQPERVRRDAAKTTQNQDRQRSGSHLKVVK